MTVVSYEAGELFHRLVSQQEMVVVDVRNPTDFQRFHVESPYPFALLNISYYDFMENEDEAVQRIPPGQQVWIVCAKEGSAKYVAEICERHGFDVRYLAGGIKSWGNLLVAQRVGGTDEYELFQFIRPGKASCSYGLLCGGEMMLFDPSRNLDFYLGFAAEHGCRITSTFETHLQADYIAGSRDVARRAGALFYASDGDFRTSKNPYHSLRNGQILRFLQGGPTIRVLLTPGHTPGSTCFIIDERYLISGDTVFINSVGRPDLGGQAEVWAGWLFSSLQLIKGLDPNLQVLPGHYMDWREANKDLLFACSLGEVLQRNTQIYTMDSPKVFFDFVRANMRPQPEEYAIIREVNGNLREESAERQEELDLGKNECAATMVAQVPAT